MDGLDFLLSLRQQFEEPASKAENALASLEKQIKREQEALTALEGKLETARGKLAELEAGKADASAVKAFENQKNAVADLETKLQDAKDALDMIAQMNNVSPETIKQAEAQVEKLTAALEEARAKLEDLEKAAGTKHVDQEAVNAQKAKIAALEKEAAASKQNIGTMQQALPAWRQFAAQSKQGAQGLQEMGAAVQQVGGPVGGLVGRVQSITQALGRGGAVGAALAFVAVLVLIAGASLAASAALSVFAIKAADAARSARLLAEAAGGSAYEGGQITAVVRQLADRVPIASDKLAEMARNLELARLRGREMQATLTSMALVASAAGDGAASKIQQIAETSKNARRFLLGVRNVFTGEYASLAGTGVRAIDIYSALAESMKISIPQARQLLDRGAVSVQKGLEALEAAASKRYGSIVARQMLSLDAQSKKLKESVSALFADVKIDRFLEGLRTVTSLFDQSSSTGHQLKKVITEAFSAIADKAADVFPYVRAATLGAVYGVLLLYLWAKKISKALSEAFGGGSSMSQAEKLALAFQLGAAAVGLFAGAILGAVLMLGALMAPLIIMTAIFVAPFVLGAVAIYAAYRAFILLRDGIGSVWSALSKVDLAKAGSQIIDGLISGIKSKISALMATIGGVADSIKGAFTGKMQIQSPSKVFEKYGQHTAEGYVIGVEGGADDAADAIEGLGGARPGAARARGGGASAGPVNLTINIYGKVDDSIIEKIRETVEDIFEQTAAGGAPA